MIWRIRITHWRITFTFAQVTDIIGVNSKLPNGQHILMWDFDDMNFPTVRNELERIQATYELPRIYILNSGKPDHHIAYCFYQCSWRKAKEIVASTLCVDPLFFKYGVYRDKFTLRVTPKEGRKPKLRLILPSRIKETAFVTELKSWVKYETLADNSPVGKREINLGDK